MEKNLKIGNRNLDVEIGLVAEIGNNHEGSIEVLEQMIGLAFDAGADAVKVQNFDPVLYVSPLDGERRRRLEKFRIDPAELQRLIHSYDNLGKCLFSTPFDLGSVDVLNKARLIKISSGDITFTQMLEKVAKTGKDLILSTGASHMHEVRVAVDTILGIWADKSVSPELAILHCVSNYPATLSQSNLLAIQALKAEFPTHTIGFSDHSIGNRLPVLAAAAGARLIEKHFTLDHGYSDFRDHQLSANPSQLSELRKELDEVCQALGTAEKVPHISENSSAIRRSITLVSDMSAGSTIMESDVLMQRPGTGLAPAELGGVLGKQLLRDVGAGQQLKPDWLSTSPKDHRPR